MSLAKSSNVLGLMSCTSLVQVVRARSELHPDRLAFTFLADGEDSEENLTFADVDRRARALAAELLHLGLSDSRALIVYEPGLDYLTALLGCMYAKFTAVPVYPPDAMRAARTMARLESIIEDAHPRVLLTTSSLRHWTESLCGQYEGLERVIATDQLDLGVDVPWEDPGISTETVAILQYTSGSTSTPKGCVITHGNLLYNFQHILQFDEPNAVAVSWLPTYHDMGLIGTTLQALHGGRRLVFMSPLSFVQRPFRWLRAISKYRAYATAGPNFAYELCLRKVSDDELQQLDLSCLTLACNGSEPIRHETLDRFVRRFEPCGLRREAFYPCYGLAEATLVVSGGAKHEPPLLRRFSAEELSRGQAVESWGTGKRVQTLVGCGRPVRGTTVRIVDPGTCWQCPDGQVGEIWVKGPGVAHGYWNREAESEETFRAYIADTLEGPFLRTGDLGFFDDGELFVVGRCKDVIIINGRNHYPQDIEATIAKCHPSLRPDTGTAFSVDVHDSERLVVVHEVVRPQKTDLSKLLTELRTEITREHEVSPYAIVLIKGGTLPKTTSGKIQRRECRARFLAGQLDVVQQWQESNGRPVLIAASPKSPQVQSVVSCNGTPTREELLSAVSRLLQELKPENKLPVTLQTRLFGDLGLTSIDAVALQALVEEYYQRQFPFYEFMAELGRRQARDAEVADFVDFLQRSFQHEGKK
jgi:acyl-CoA synthetase (AMP-forming)/AMP-acid ligase II/acyl carrier protein